MANPEHVALVRKGAEAIAKWRQAHPEEDIDLSGANLHGAYLSGANLSGANLSGANLRRADLGEANLSQADLGRAELWRAELAWADLSQADLSRAGLFRTVLLMTNLSGANLRGADLRAANLRWADLSEADLSEANLGWADLIGTSLRGADLSRAQLAVTALGGLDLSDATGLADVQHQYPSSVGMDTLITSVRGAGGKLTPELTTFFRGAGVPQELLDALHKIVSEIGYYSCFISYGQPDVGFATRLDGDLRARNVNCWTYEKDKTVGKPTWSEIEQKLDEYERMVVVCSIKALIRDGFKKEVDKQIDKNPDKLIPVSLDDDWKQDGFKAEWAGRDLKKWLMDRNWADFSGWERDQSRYDKALEELLKGLELEKPPN